MHGSAGTQDSPARTRGSNVERHLAEGSAVSTPRRALLLTKNDFRAERDGGSQPTAAAVRALESAGDDVDWVAVRPFASSTNVVRHRLAGLS